MERELPKRGEIYQHFKGTTYVVLAVAINATNGFNDELMVVYTPESQRDEPNRNYYCRTLEEFNARFKKT